MNPDSDIGTQFSVFLAQIPDRNAHIHILTDPGADGLPAATILLKALKQAGYLRTTAAVRLKFESAWSPAAGLAPSYRFKIDFAQPPQQT